jgi:hypothetical protein
MKCLGLTPALILLLAGGGFAKEKDSCFDCHSVMEGTSITFKADVHYRNGLSCADCHGGDASEPDQNLSMSASRGFKVRVTREATPGYCGSCHEEAGFMEKYRPHGRVDQLALYQKSVHGKLLAAGRKDSAECVDCHGVHDIRSARDARAPTNPRRLSETCGKCHRETAELFRLSAHGRIFISARRPGCTVCHASHATEVATSALLTSPVSGCVACHKPGSADANAAAEIAQLLASLESQGPGGREALARARVAVHSLDFAAVRRAVDPSLPVPAATPVEPVESAPVRPPAKGRHE